MFINYKIQYQKVWSAVPVGLKVKIFNFQNFSFYYPNYHQSVQHSWAFTLMVVRVLIEHSNGRYSSNKKSKLRVDPSLKHGRKPGIWASMNRQPPFSRFSKKYYHDQFFLRVCARPLVSYSVLFTDHYGFS
jgi:hypothetical protein